MEGDENETTSLLGANYQDSNYGLIAQSELNFASSIVEGEVDEHKTSPVRRTFLLIAFFDFLVIAILWFLYAKFLPGKTFEDNVENQIVHLKFDSSLFDNTMCAFVRFVWTQISYCAVRSKKIYYQAFSTFATTVYTVAKISLFKGDENLHALEYSQIFINLLFPWLMSLFLDCRVLPQEKAADRHHEFKRLMSQEYPRSRTGTRTYQSIYGSPNGSVNTDVFSSFNQAFFDSAMIKKLSESLESAAKKIYRNNKWKKFDYSDRELVQSQKINNLGIKEKIFRLDGIIYATPRAIIKEFTDNAENTHIWNPLVDDMRVVESHPDLNSDVVYSKIKDIAGGLISARDFVIFRKWHLADSDKEVSYIIGNSTDHPACPPRNGVQRGYQSVNHVFIEPLEGEVKKSHITILLAVDLCGWFPSSVTDRGTKDSMSTYFSSFKKQIASYSVPVNFNQIV